MAANLLLARWANQGVNLWGVDLQTVTLVQGQATYSVPLNTVVMLDAYVTTNNGSSQPIDRIILPVSRTEYSSYPNKEQQGFPTVFWFDRLINPNPSVTLWPVPDGSSAQTFSYYRVRQLQDAILPNATNVEIPYLWLEAFAFGLAARLAVIWAPTIAPMLKDAAVGYTDRYKVIWLARTSRRLDQKKLKAEQPDIFKRYSADCPSRVLRHQELKGGKTR